MNSRKIAIVIIPVVLLTLCSIEQVLGQRANSKRTARSVRNKEASVHDTQKSGRNLSPNLPPARLMRNMDFPILNDGGQGPFWTVTVDWGLQLDAPTQALYQQLADLFSTLTTVPADRTNFYSALAQQRPDLIINGWNGMLTNVQTNPDGTYTVTVTAIPSFSNATQLTVLSLYSERYSVDQNMNVTYLGFLDPENLAGTLPAMSND